MNLRGFLTSHWTPLLASILSLLVYCEGRFIVGWPIWFKPGKFTIPTSGNTLNTGSAQNTAPAPVPSQTPVQNPTPTPAPVQNTVLEEFKWGYGPSNGPNVWATHFPNCGGTSQSPIDLPNIPPNMALPPQPFEIPSSWHKTMTNLEILNDGHDIQVNIPPGKLLRGGGLPADFMVAQFHFHWGSNPTVGSEHTLGGRSTAVELHVVSYNTALGSFDVAKSTKNGLAVMGFFMHIGTFNKFFQPIVQTLPALTESDCVSTVSKLNLYDLIGSSVKGQYFRYHGSLTTPTCDESVIWTVFREPIYMSYHQWAQFKPINGNDGSLANNFRPVQPLNGREVKLYGSW